MFKTAFTQETCKNFKTSGLPEAFDWLNLSLDIAKSLKEGDFSIPPDLQSKLRAPSILAQKLETWLIRSEDDIPTEVFLEKFNTYCLPDWDHYTHIRFAYLILVKHGRQEGNEIFLIYIEASY